NSSRALPSGVRAASLPPSPASSRVPGPVGFGAGWGFFPSPGFTSAGPASAPAGFADSAHRPATRAPEAKSPAITSAAEAPFNLVRNMVFNPPSVSAATLTEITPAAAARPAANRPAALMVHATTEVGAEADATFCASTAASDAPDTARPC